MILKFYKVSDDSRVLNKTLGEPIHTCLNASVYEDCSIVSPSFLVDYSHSVIACNYLEATVMNGSIIAWKRYYYVDDFVLMPGGRMVAKCNEDVLMSFKDEILGLKCNVVRHEKKLEINDPYLIDRYRTPESRSFVDTIKSTDSPFIIPGNNNWSYLLTVIGGYAAHANEGS